VPFPRSPHQPDFFESERFPQLGNVFSCHGPKLAIGASGIRTLKQYAMTDAAPSFLFPDIGTLLLSLPALAFNLSFALGKP
jgi:hypothetical protein